jgi:hypothetical protein
MGNGLDLETVIRGLHSSEIRVGLQTFSEGIMVWVSDRLHRTSRARIRQCQSTDNRRFRGTVDALDGPAVVSRQ